jgi:tripartite-type tricarboxylate transporter receptor subunit TctC
LLGIMLAATLPTAAWSQGAYPSQPIRLVVPFAPGGGNDVFARTVAPVMGELLGQTIVVENRPGASGSVGAGAVSRTMPADGYTILLSEVSIHSVNAHLQKGLPYDAERDLKPVAKAGTYDYVLVVNPKTIQARTLAELRGLAAKASADLAYGVPGIGTPHHLGMELLASKTGMKLSPIAYRGAAPAVQDLLAGQIQLMLSDRAAVRGHIANGTLHAIATAGAKRVPEMPDVPTIAESGVPDFAMESWFGFSVRTGTPDAVVQKISETYAKAITRPGLVEKLREAGINVTHMPPEPFTAFVHSETQRWGSLIRERGIKAN